MSLVIYSSMISNHGALMGGRVAACWPREKFAARPTDKLSGI